ncbi:MAG: hypothetical protein MJ153_05060 [Clostridia bacterium]|nr:hypothetical protein [Clostridia bacterium]
MNIKEHVLFSSKPIELLSTEEQRQIIRDHDGISADFAKDTIKNVFKGNNGSEFEAPDLSYIHPNQSYNGTSDNLTVEGTCIGYLYSVEYSTNNSTETGTRTPHLVSTPVFEYVVDGVTYDNVIGIPARSTEVYVNARAQIICNKYDPNKARLSPKHKASGSASKNLFLIFGIIAVLIAVVLNLKPIKDLMPSNKHANDTIITKTEIAELQTDNDGKSILTDSYLADLSNNYSYDCLSATNPEVLYKYEKNSLKVLPLSLMIAFAFFAGTVGVILNAKDNLIRKEYAGTFDNTYVNKNDIQQIDSKCKKKLSMSTVAIIIVSSLFIIIGIAMLFFTTPKVYNHYCPGKDWDINKWNNVQVNMTENELTLSADSFSETYQNGKDIAVYIDESVSGECYVVRNNEGIVGIFPVDSYVYEGTKEGT